MMEFEPFPEDEVEGNDRRRPSTIQSIAIAARFLDILASAERALPLAELARLAGAGRSTAHRYLQSLVKEGLASQDPVSSHYDLGPAALGIGIAALKRVDGIEMAGNAMKILAETQAMSCGVAIWTERGPTLVRWYRSAYFSITPLGLGDVLPIDNTACGLVFQAWLAPGRVRVARGNQPVHFRGTAPAAGLLDEIRGAGWCELTSHLLPNVTGQAAPVLDAQRELVCVVTSVTDLGQLKTPDQREALRAAARRINQATGGAAFLGE